MKHSLLLLAAAALFAPAALAQHAPQPSVDPIALPSGINSVSPTQGFVDVSPNANPKGLGEITLNFSAAPTVNTSCTAEAKCWYNGQTNPISTATVANIAVDMMGVPMASIMFAGPLTQPGTYHIEIPEGMLIVNGTTTPAVALNYEIYDLYHLTPAPGVVDNFSQISLLFPNADKVTVKPSAVEFLLVGTDNLTPLSFKQTSEIPGGPQNTVVMSFLEEDGDTPLPYLTTPGTYLFHAVADAFTAITYGPNYASDPTDYVEWKSPEIVCHYQVADFPAPAIEPEEGDVESFEKFTLTMPSDFQLFMVDNMTTSYIYPLLADGTVGTEVIARLKASRDWDIADEVYLTVVGGEPVTPAPGKYVLVLSNALISGMYDGAFINTVSYRYVYNVVGDPNSVTGVRIEKPVFQGIYTLDGKRISEDANLPAGLYIIDGKKTLRK